MAALIIVDVQYDFISGSLAVTDAASVIPIVNRLLDHATSFKTIIASQDYHPKHHVSFASTHALEPFTKLGSQELWPDHCVAGTKGCEIEESIRGRLEGLKATIVRKGTAIDVDAYSAFATENETGSIVSQLLQEDQIKDVYIVGIATDYCVRQTTLSALALNLYKVHIIKEGVRGVDAVESEKTLLELEGKGVTVISIDDFEAKMMQK